MLSEKEMKQITEILRKGKVKLMVYDIKSNKLYKSFYNGFNLKENEICICIER